MPLHLLEYSKNYSKTTGSLWNHHRHEPNSGVNGSINYSIRGSKSSEYKANFIEESVTQNNLTNNGVQTVVPLKHLSNFWRILDMPSINCEIKLILNWSKNCV